MTTEQVAKPVVPTTEATPGQEAPKPSRFQEFKTGFMAGASDTDKLELGAYALEVAQPDIEKIKRGHDVALSLAKNRGWEKVAQEERDAIRDERIEAFVDRGVPKDTFEADEDGYLPDLKTVKFLGARFLKMLGAANARNGKAEKAEGAKPEDGNAAVLARIAELEAKVARGSGTAGARLASTDGGGAGGETVTRDNIDKLWMDYETQHPGAPNPYDRQYRAMLGR